MSDDPIKAVFIGARPQDVSGEMADRIRAVIYEYSGRTTVASTVGVLTIVIREILEDQDDT